MWTRFMDMHSGGGQKLDWSHIYIEAPEDEARRVFYAKFGRNPDNVTCDCCGNDYTVDESPSLALATAHERGLRSYRGVFDKDKREWVYPNGSDWYLEPDEVPVAGWEVSESFRRDKGNGITLDEFIKRAGDGDTGVAFGCTARIVWAGEITDAERRGPKGKRQEKVWVDVEE